MAAILNNCIFQCHFIAWEFYIQISLKFIGPMDNKTSLVQTMTWRRTADKPLSEPMIANLTNVYMSRFLIYVPVWKGSKRLLRQVLNDLSEGFATTRASHESLRLHLCAINTVPQQKFVTKIWVRYQDLRWRRQQAIWMFALLFLILRIRFGVFETG